jgi:hypothetical protein
VEFLLHLFRGATYVVQCEEAACRRRLICRHTLKLKGDTDILSSSRVTTAFYYTLYPTCLFSR